MIQRSRSCYFGSCLSDVLITVGGNGNDRRQFQNHLNTGALPFNNHLQQATVSTLASHAIEMPFLSNSVFFFLWISGFVEFSSNLCLCHPSLASPFAPFTSPSSLHSLIYLKHWGPANTFFQLQDHWTFQYLCCAIIPFSVSESWLLLLLLSIQTLKSEGRNLFNFSNKLIKNLAKAWQSGLMSYSFSRHRRSLRLCNSCFIILRLSTDKTLAKAPMKFTFNEVIDDKDFGMV